MSGDGDAGSDGEERRWRRPFPDGEGSDPFLRKFKEAVVPGTWRRALQDDVLPVLILDTTGRDGDDTTRHAKRVLDGLEDTLIRGGREDGYDGDKLTPYARPAVHAETPPGDEYLVLKAGAELRANTPRKCAPLPHRHLRLMTDLTRQIRENPGEPVPGGRALRDHAYSLRAEKADGGVLHFLAGFAAVGFNGPLAWLGDLIALFGKSVLYRFPRWCWSAWWTRRLLRSKRNWYEQWRRMGRTDESVFEKVNQLLTRQSERLGRDEEAAEAARQDLEELLMRALLADLHDARPGRFGPRARRRRTRRVVLLDLPSADGPSAAATNRFLHAYRNAAGAPGTASLLVIGAGGAAAYQKQDWRRCQNLRHGAELFAPVQAEAVALPLLVPLKHQGFDEEGIFVTRVEPGKPRPDVKPGTELTAEVAACAVVLAVVAALVPWGPAVGPEDSCYDGTRVAGTRPPKPLPERATEKDTARKQYDSVVERIGELNESAVESERKKDESTRSTVRKVVYLGATVPSDPEEAIDNGAVPELRGLLLAQERLNADAVDDRENRVRLYVDVRDTGNKFENVVEHAERVVKEAKRFKESKDHRTIVGVVGFSESRAQTQKAASVLDEGQVPVIGTTATADAMQWNPERHKKLTYYRPMAPSNSRESRTAAAFVRSARVADDRDGHCRVATRAVVVAEPDDLFSSEMSEKFARRFGPGAETLPLANRGEGGGMPPVSVAKTVCERVKQEPRTIVYWAARVRNFSAFVNAYGPDSGCGGLRQRLTVLGSNELTSTALRGKYEEPWLRLYHSVHVLPEKHPDNNGQADRLFQDYVDAYTAEDPWLNDGHVALAHDALKVLSTATDDAFSSTGTAHTELVKSKLDEEIVFQGASGVIDFPERHGSKPPPDKALTILHVTPKGPEVALHCGAFKENEPPVSRWGRNGEHACPTDG
ncbi:hypothetical protein [Streptomyces albidus (ex Kaewkla and Franco 2022)]|uniref:hypothetical protein n=1 Tax=Streptomyces albidus (ex Kaewkla and Franco 2022) TaxID=722709 RepID=UPI0015EE92AA|nr:hypothetical protein [Streptomyces albidus (ex Kaewkla and Franco 2022)]